MKKHLSRRRFLGSLAGVGAGALLAACQPKVVEVEKEVTRVVEKEVEKVVKEAVEVEKEVTRVIEKSVEKVVTPTAVPADELKGEIVTLFHHGSWEQDVWAKKADMFHEIYPNIELVSVSTSDDYAYVQKASTMFAGGQPPDLTKLSGGRLIATAPKGIWEDLQPRIDVSPLMQRIWDTLPGKAQELNVMGKQYGLTRDQQIGLMYYNKDLFAERGVQEPAMDWSWEDFVSKGQALTDVDNNVYMWSPGTHSFQDASAYFWQAGGNLFSDDCMKVHLGEDPNIESMEWLAKNFNEWNIAPPREMNLGEIGVSFDTGKLGMTRSGTGVLSKQLGDQATWGFDWSATYAPGGPGGQADYVKSGGWAIGKGSTNAELGWIFIEWWLADEQQTTFAEWGEAVARNDIFKSVGLKNLPEHLHPAFDQAFEMGRGLERCPAWSLCQKFWREEMDPVWLGRITAREGMMNAQAKAQPALEELMEELGVS